MLKYKMKPNSLKPVLKIYVDLEKIVSDVPAFASKVRTYPFLHNNFVERVIQNYLED